MVKEIVALEVDSSIIVGQLYLPEDDEPPYPTLCVCHGIPASISVPGDGGYPLLAERICHQGFAVLIFNFRGTGESGGNFDILGWTRDLKVVIDYLFNLAEVDRSRLALLGFSGGAAVSVYVAARDRRVAYLALCACPPEFTFFTKANEAQSIIDRFRSIGAIRDKNFPSSTEEWLAGFKLISPISYITRITPRPLLMVHGSSDETVDVSHACKLYNKAGEPKQLIIIDGATHRLRQNEKAMAVVINWLKSNARIGY